MDGLLLRQTQKRTGENQRRLDVCPELPYYARATATSAFDFKAAVQTDKDILDSIAKICSRREAHRGLWQRPVQLQLARVGAVANPEMKRRRITGNQAPSDVVIPLTFENF